MGILSVLVVLSKSALVAAGVCWDCGEPFLFLSRADGCLGLVAGTSQAIVFLVMVTFVPRHCKLVTQHQASPKCFHSSTAWGVAGMSPVTSTCGPGLIFGWSCYQSVLSMSSDTLVLDGAIESLLIIQHLLKIQVTLFVSWWYNELFWVMLDLMAKSMCVFSVSLYFSTKWHEISRLREC